MTETDAQKMERANESWKTKIIDEFNTMASSIIALRGFAEHNNDADLLAKVETLHLIYCEMANTVSLRILLNGALQEQERAHDADEAG